MPSWKEVQVGKKQKKAWLAALFYVISGSLAEGNKKNFEDMETLNQSLKSSFMTFFLDHVRYHIEENTTPSINFLIGLELSSCKQ